MSGLTWLRSDSILVLQIWRFCDFGLCSREITTDTMWYRNRNLTVGFLSNVVHRQDHSPSTWLHLLRIYWFVLFSVTLTLFQSHSVAGCVKLKAVSSVCFHPPKVHLNSFMIMITCDFGFEWRQIIWWVSFCGKNTLMLRFFFTQTLSKQDPSILTQR